MSEKSPNEAIEIEKGRLYWISDSTAQNVKHQKIFNLYR